MKGQKGSEEYKERRKKRPEKGEDRKIEGSLKTRSEKREGHNVPQSMVYKRGTQKVNRPRGRRAKLGKKRGRAMGKMDMQNRNKNDGEQQGYDICREIL